MLYEILDVICDAYNPGTFLLCLGLIVRSAIKRIEKWWGSIILVIVGILVAYGLMIVDNHFSIWASVGYDYSTHTAVATVLTIIMAGWFKIRWWPVTTLVYFVLMLVQQYHSVIDIVSTATISSIAMVLIGLPAFRLEVYRDTKWYIETPTLSAVYQDTHSKGTKGISTKTNDK